MKKTLAMLLALLMLLPAFTACAESETNTETTAADATVDVTAGAEEETVPEETEMTRATTPDNLP
ncbi:MAG: hypothetical protein E7579_11155, partial [Ruminococcaceae bacterium]|nr:hypothetical protein [Oscillospiraceae bacterium]